MATVRFAEVLREASRNVASGTARALIALVVFSSVVGVVGVAQARGIVGVAQRAQAWRAQGSSVQIVSLQGGIDGAQCDALAGAPNIVTAGALRSIEPARVALLPSTPVQAFEVTPGIAQLLRATSNQEKGWSGVWLADDLAHVLGDGIASLPILSDDGTGADSQVVDVAGVYHYPSDGRIPTLSYSLLAPVPAVGAFDACWVEIWPESESATVLLSLPVNAPLLEGGKREAPQVQQLNGTMGRAFDGPARLDTLPVWPLTAAALVLVAALVCSQMMARRLEFASALHADIDKASLLLQVQAECLAWTLTGTAIVLSITWVAAVQGNPEPAWVAFFPAVRSTTLSVFTAHLSALVMALGIREKHLFRHFKQR